jgi:galactokinase
VKPAGLRYHWPQSLSNPMRAQALALFHTSFTTAPRAAASAPGRVNLIGEHTDYNGGPVLPIAIAARTTAIVGDGDPGALEIVSARDAQPQSLEWKGDLPGGWGGYLAGVLRELWSLGVRWRQDGVRVAVASDIPIGAGLSSSAALTVATAKALALLGGARLTPRQLAAVAYRAEHDHVGVKCGVMDQTIAALGKPGHALLLECATLATRQIPFRGRLLLVDTGVRHELGRSAFNQRTAECRAAVERLRVDLPELLWLAAWPAAWLARLKRALPEPLRARAVHVVSETARTRFGAQLLGRGRLRQFGKLMFESHESLRRLYDCSSPELDLVVAAARRAGAWGARMTGAGWGGAALVLVPPKRETAITERIRSAFAAAYGRDPGVRVVRAAGGVRRERV